MFFFIYLMIAEQISISSIVALTSCSAGLSYYKVFGCIGRPVGCYFLTVFSQTCRHQLLSKVLYLYISHPADRFLLIVSLQTCFHQLLSKVLYLSSALGVSFCFVCYENGRRFSSFKISLKTVKIWHFLDGVSYNWLRLKLYSQIILLKSPVFAQFQSFVWQAWSTCSIYCSFIATTWLVPFPFPAF